MYAVLSPRLKDGSRKRHDGMGKRTLSNGERSQVDRSDSRR